MNLHAYSGATPWVADDAFIAPGAQLIGRVHVGSEASVWFNAVLRGDVEPIHIGPRSNVQDGAIMHTDDGCPLSIGAGVTVGHGAILHGCTVEDGALIGMGAVVLNRARIGRGALVGAGTLVPEGVEIPAGHLALGVPARVVRPLTADELARLKDGVQHYLDRARAYRASLARPS